MRCSSGLGAGFGSPAEEAEWAKEPIRRIAEGDSNLEVSTGAQAALIAFHPPATGVLVASAPHPRRSGAAAGLRPGDIILQYGGLRTLKRMHLGQAITRHKNDAEPIEMVVYRDGQRVELLAPPGPLGFHSRAVKVPE